MMLKLRRGISASGYAEPSILHDGDMFQVMSGFVILYVYSQYSSGRTVLQHRHCPFATSLLTPGPMTVCSAFVPRQG
jgi:hypothetical protein